MAVSTGDIYLGHGSVVGFALETTWGTAVDPTAIWCRLVSATLNNEYQQAERPHLHGSAGRVALGYHVERHDAGFTAEVELAYSAIGLLLRAAMGPAPTTTGSGPYVHPFLLGAVLPSFTARFHKGESASGTLTNRYWQFAGCKISKATIVCATEDVVRLRIEVIAKLMTRGDQGTPTILAPTPVIYHQRGTIAWNSAVYDGNGFELSIDNAVTRRRNVGSLYTAEPHPGALRTIRFMLDRDHCDEELVAALVAETESDLAMTFTAGSESLAIEVQNARVISPTSLSLSEGGFGAIAESVEFAPRASGSDLGLTITVTNANASYLS